MMDTGQKRLFYSGVLSSNTSEFGDDDSSNPLDEDTFDLPLKSKVMKNANFSELEDDWDSRPGTPLNPKKVRFEPGEEPNFDTVEQITDDTEVPSETKSPVDHTPTGSSSKSKPHVEDLIEYANQVNDYLSANMEKINSFQSDLMNNKGVYKLNSDTATQHSATWGSLSNFELSETEPDLHQSNSDFSSSTHLNNSGSNDNSNNDLRRLLSNGAMTNSGNNFDTDGAESCISSSSSSSSLSGGDHNTLENSPTMGHRATAYTLLTEVPNSPEAEDHGLHFENLSIRPSFNHEESPEEKYVTLLLRTDTPYNEFPQISPEEALHNLEETIDIILNLSKRDNDDLMAHNSTIPYHIEYSNFKMKNTPALSYKDFMERIQSKCMFGSIIYLQTAHLLQLLFMTREEINGPLKLKYRLADNEVHRLIISSMRISAMLLEDFVHSHEYICKVCGISKKLLSKLEVSFLLVLKHDGLMVTSEKLTSSVHILNEMRQL